ncbi:MAG: OmpH family outer membrane protein, partial [Chlorobiaceae bacterium]|nr:OmpH family outer membrane protein [Chlorobiaceae bacterium]
MNYSKRFVNASRRAAMAVALSFALAAPQTFAAQSAEKVGVVDSGKILERLPETKQAEASMKERQLPFALVMSGGSVAEHELRGNARAQRGPTEVASQRKQATP